MSTRLIIALVVNDCLSVFLMTGPVSSHSDTADSSYGLLLPLGCSSECLYICIPNGAYEAALYFDVRLDASRKPGYGEATGSSPRL